MFKDRVYLLQLLQNIDIEKYINKAVDIFLSSDILLVGGNGGSAADASHFVGELMGRFDGIVSPFPTINMMSDIAYTSAISNDYNFTDIYYQFITAFSKFDTSYLFITTSGKSHNIEKAVEILIEEYNNEKIVILTGNYKRWFDNIQNIHVIHIPDIKTEYIQETCLMILHEIARKIKHKLV